MAAAEVPVPRAHSGAIERRRSEAKKTASLRPLCQKRGKRDWNEQEGDWAHEGKVRRDSSRAWGIGALGRRCCASACILVALHGRFHAEPARHRPAERAGGFGIRRLAAAEVPVPRTQSGVIEQRPSEAKKNASLRPKARQKEIGTSRRGTGHTKARCGEIQAVLGGSAHMGGSVARQLAFL